MQKVVQLSSVHVVGDTRVFYKISSSLAERGYDVDLIIQAEKDFEKNGVSIKSIPIAKTKIQRLFVTLPSLFRKAIEYPPNTIFHFHDPELIVVGLFLKLVGYKVIYDVHEDVPLDILTKHWVPVWARRWLSGALRRMEEWSAQKFDAVITVVPSITERFKNSRVTEIRNYPGIDEKEAGKASSKSSEIYVVYLGDLTSRRGIPAMVKAMQYLESDEIYLHLGGTFSEANLKEKLEGMTGWLRTSHKGWIPQEEAKVFLKGAIAGLLTLDKVPSHIGSLPVKLFEYMAAGIPVISSDIPLWMEIIEDGKCGIIVDPKHPQEIAKAIKYLVDNPEVAKKMGENGRRVVLKKYNWNKEREKLFSLYSQVSSDKEA